MTTVDRIIVSAPSVWHDDYRVTIITRHRSGAGVWDGAGDTPQAALTQAALCAGVLTRVLPSGDTVRAYRDAIRAGQWSLDLYETVGGN